MLSYLQKLGKSLMLPIAVLPIAALMLRLGQKDLLDIAFMANAGQAIFDNLPMLFALGVSVGISRDGNGAAGLAGAVAYFTLTTCAQTINADIEMGVFGGLIAGVLAGELYNKFSKVQLPDFLGFFAGRRLVPILSGLSALGIGAILGWVWPHIQNVLSNFSHTISEMGAVGTFIFGFLNRLLIPVGLHHVLNSFFWFELGSFQNGGDVVKGDLNRFFAGDPTAGYFMSGFFPVMMFGMIGICLAIYMLAKKEHKKVVGGVLISVGLTSFLTGITEPIEFLFMFIAPFLYFIHAVLTGISFALTRMLEVRIGFGFSGSVLDYLLNFRIGNNSILIIPLGIAFFFAYFGIFYTVMKYMKIDVAASIYDSIQEEKSSGEGSSGVDEEVDNFFDALGGIKNVVSVDNCITRLRLDVKDNSIIDEQLLLKLGSKGVIKPSKTTVQVVLGQKAERIADEMKKKMK